MNPVVGALAANARAIAEFAERASAVGSDLFVTPELALSGYPPEDLVAKEGFERDVARTLDEMRVAPSNTVMAVGAPLSAARFELAVLSPDDARERSVGAHGREPVANAVAVLDRGRLTAVATKRLLPNYDVFDEQRVFRAGAGQPCVLAVAGAAVGIIICEDVWVKDGPAAACAAAGASLIVVPNGSPFARGRRAEREAALSERAAETGCYLAYVNQVGGQDELVFDGQSFIVDPRGDVIARAGAFTEELLVVDLELPASAEGTAVGTEHRGRVAISPPSRTPPAPIEETYEALVLGTRDYLHKNGFQSAVVNLSGGVDSALVTVIAADAIGPSNVRCFALPSRYSSVHSLEDAVELARRVGVELTEMSIESAHVALAGTITPAVGTEPSGLTDENLQSRIRGLILMALSNASGAIALTTGNKSELATGYFTLYGDSVGGFAVIKDVPKTLVYQLCEWRNAQARAEGVIEPIPQRILEKAPSAELRENQRDDQSLPPYDVLDPLLELYVDDDRTAEEMVALGHDRALVERVVRLVDLAEYKRRQMPPGVRISKKAFGKDRRVPITNAYRPGS